MMNLLPGFVWHLRAEWKEDRGGGKASKEKQSDMGEEKRNAAAEGIQKHLMG